ncbi:PE-PPE domain-containing protein [Mycobacterium sp.]|uniref:PE family protein n=1 Tax=Mycobacterium sp. TaxID=1785 RepID=UPI00260054D0|nr:PE-PPE domain-containing protein [Mycobacterium sp.]MBW0012458.1 PE-PPE domain-containing protein [Mycobacterium sp.]
MSFVIAAPEELRTGATNLARIGSSISAANAAAAGATTGLPAAAADEVSAATASLFSRYASAYQTLSAQAAAFHDRFVRTLKSNALAYAGAEAGNVEQVAMGAAQQIQQVGDRLVGTASGAGGSGNSGVPVVLTANNQPGAIGVADTALIMGGTGFNPLYLLTGATGPGVPPYINAVERLYLSASYPGYTPEFLVTPNQLYPLTGLRSLTFDASVARGVSDLNAAIMAQHAAGHSTVVFGYSQSATIATLEERHLMTLPATQRPGTDQLSFVLVGNPDRPDGGLLERFNGSVVRGLGFTFFGATPVNAYPTTDIAIQYDGAADFPQYPLDIVADANAIAGFIYLHPQYPYLTHSQIASGVVEPVSPTDTETTYILIPTQNLPLLDPVRALPLVGRPLADLVQPDMRVLVELGYDRSAYQDVPTPYALFPNIDPATVASELWHGAAQGVNGALADEGLPAFG